MVSAQCVHWFVPQAQKDWWTEEVEILEEEMARVLHYFKFFEKCGNRSQLLTPQTRVYLSSCNDVYDIQ